MGVVKQWQIEKLDLAERLYAALADLIGDVEDLCYTDAHLSWRSACGIQGHWRESGGVFYLGRIFTDPHGAGMQSMHLALELDSMGDDEDRVFLVYPQVYYSRMTDGPVVGCDADTPQIYAAAQAMLTQLSEELRTILPYARDESEETNDAV